MLKQILTSCHEYGAPVHMIFIDFKKTYDLMKRLELWKAFEKLETPEKIILLDWRYNGERT